MKRLFTALLILALLVLPVQAASSFVIDEADLLSETEEAAITERIENIRTQYQLDVVILTMDSLNGQRPQEYADDYYDNHGYAEDGLLFLLSMEERDWYISTCGSAIQALTDYGIAQVGETAVGYLAVGDYAGGFAAFLDALPHYFDQLSNGSPVDGNSREYGGFYRGDREEVICYETHTEPSSLLISILIGAAVGGITILVMRSSMNTLKKQRSAGDYLNPGSFHLRIHRDMFLYSNVSKVRKQEPSSSGGSSVHRSSSGRSHGGGGGKF